MRGENAKERNWMFIVMPNDHLIYIAYNSPSVLEHASFFMLKHIFSFKLRKRLVNQLTFIFEELKYFIMQLPLFDFMQIVSLIYLRPVKFPLLSTPSIIILR